MLSVRLGAMAERQLTTTARGRCITKLTTASSVVARTWRTLSAAVCTMHHAVEICRLCPSPRYDFEQGAPPPHWRGKGFFAVSVLSHH